MRDLLQMLSMFDRMPQLLAIEMRPSDDVWFLCDGERGPEMPGLAGIKNGVPDPIFSAEETLAAVQEFYPDSAQLDWAHFYSGGKRIFRHPEYPVVVRILYEPAGFNLLFIRSDE